MDLDIKNTVQFLYDGGYLNNTLFILMGDHGARYYQVRSTVPGKLEERLPYFSFLFPKWFQEKYPEAIKNLRTNAKRLTTPFDMYYTFKEFLQFSGTGLGNDSQRGMSLFKEVPLSRTCEKAGIAPHWCACMSWKNVSISDPDAKQALHVALDTINGYTANYRADCALLSIDNVTMATKMETRSEVLKFTNADQNGGIYQVNFKSKNKNEQTLYQVTFYTTPGGGHYEVTVTHDLVNKKFLVSEKEISRINKYGNAPHCILNRNRQIRAYCYCKDLIKQ